MRARKDRSMGSGLVAAGLAVFGAVVLPACKKTVISDKVTPIATEAPKKEGEIVADEAAAAGGGAAAHGSSGGRASFAWLSSSAPSRASAEKSSACSSGLGAARGGCDTSVACGGGKGA